jgi:thioredoxin-related protein
MFVWAISRKGILRDLSSPCKIFQVRMTDPSFSRKGKKLLQDPGYFAKINQEFLSISCMINQDHYCLARKSEMP